MANFVPLYDPFRSPYYKKLGEQSRFKWALFRGLQSDMRAISRFDEPYMNVRDKATFLAF